MRPDLLIPQDHVKNKSSFRIDEVEAVLHRNRPHAIILEIMVHMDVSIQHN